MNFTAATAAIRKFFAEEWDEETAIAYDDDNFAIPNGESWVRLNIQHNIGYQASMGSPGSNRQRREGLVFIQIFQPQGQFSTEARRLADLAADIFIGQTYENIHFYDVTAREVGNDGRGWYQINVIASFRYDRIA